MNDNLFECILTSVTLTKSNLALTDSEFKFYQYIGYIVYSPKVS